MPLLSFVNRNLSEVRNLYHGCCVDKISEPRTSAAGVARVTDRSESERPLGPHFLSILQVDKFRCTMTKIGLQGQDVNYASDQPCVSSFCLCQSFAAK